MSGGYDSTLSVAGVSQAVQGCSWVWPGHAWGPGLPACTGWLGDHHSIQRCAAWSRCAGMQSCMVMRDRLAQLSPTGGCSRGGGTLVLTVCNGQQPVMHLPLSECGETQVTKAETSERSHVTCWSQAMQTNKQQRPDIQTLTQTETDSHKGRHHPPSKA